MEDADEFEKDYNFRFEVEEGRLESLNFTDSSRHFSLEFGAASFLQCNWSFRILHGPAGRFRATLVFRKIPFGSGMTRGNDSERRKPNGKKLKTYAALRN